MKRLLVILMAAVMLIGCSNKSEAVKEKEYEVLEPETYRELPITLESLIVDYNESRRTWDLPKMDDERSDDGHIRNKTFDEKGSLVFIMNENDTVNNLEYIGDNPLIMNAVFEVLGLNEDEEVKLLLSEAGQANKNSESYSKEIRADNMNIQYHYGGTDFVSLRVYGDDALSKE